MHNNLGVLLGRTTICIFDGSPGGRIGETDLSLMWRFAADAGATFFGAGAAFYASCLKAGLVPTKLADLSKMRAIGSAGSPLAIDVHRWISAQTPKGHGRDSWPALSARHVPNETLQGMRCRARFLARRWSCR